MKKPIFAIIFLFFFVGFAQATDYYVDADAADDTGTGAIGDPWKTVAHAFAKIEDGTVSDGDTVHLQKGDTWTTTGNDFIINSGRQSQADYVTIRGDDYGSGAEPILQKSTSGNVVVGFDGQDYIIFRNITVQSSGGADNHGIYIDGAVGRTTNHIQILNCTVKNVTTGSTAYYCGIWLRTREGAVSDITIQGNDVSGCSAHGVNHYGGSAGNNSTNVIWSENYIHSPDSSHYTYQDGAQIRINDGSGCVFEKNFIEGDWGGTIDAGALLDLGNDGGEMTSTATVRYNICRDDNYSTQDIAGIEIAGRGSKGTVLFDIYGNLIYGNRYAGFVVNDSSDYLETDSIINFYNNTLYGNYTNASATTHAEFMIWNSMDGTLNVKNNILAHNTDNGSCWYIKNDFTGTLTHSNNLFWNYYEDGVNDEYALDDDRSGGTDYYIDTVTTWEVTAQKTDPSLTNVAGDDLTIQSGSPCIDTGVNLGTTYDDALDPSSSWPDAVTTGDQDDYGAGWEIGAYLFNPGTGIPGPGCAGTFILENAEIH